MPEGVSPFASSSSSGSSLFEQEQGLDAGEAMVRGAQKLMEQKPRWIPSLIAKDSLPKVKSSCDPDGREIDKPEDRDSLGAENDFAKWLRGQPELPKQGALMNCWEAVFTSAYYGDLIDKEQLIKLFKGTANTADPTKALLNSLGRETAALQNKKAKPSPGDIILIDNNRNVGFHVFIAGNVQEEYDLVEEETIDVDYAFSHDRSDANKGFEYAPGYNSGPMGNYKFGEGSEESMVYRNREHITSYVTEWLERKTPLGTAEIRYLSPGIFKTLPKEAAKHPLG